MSHETDEDAFSMIDEILGDGAPPNAYSMGTGPASWPEDLPAQADPEAPRLSGDAAHKDRLIASLAEDDEEIAAYARFFGIDTSDPNPGSEALVLLRTLMDASAKVGGAIAKSGDRLDAMLATGTEDRRAAADALAEAAVSLLDASAAFESAAGDVEAGSAAASAKLAEAADAMKALVGRSAANAAELVKPGLAKAAEVTLAAALAKALDGFRDAAAIARDGITASMEDAAIKAAATVTREVDGMTPKIKAAVASGIARADKGRADADPWRWRKAVVLAAALVSCMLVSGWLGRSAGYESGYDKGASMVPRSAAR